MPWKSTNLEGQNVLADPKNPCMSDWKGITPIHSYSWRIGTLKILFGEGFWILRGMWSYDKKLLAVSCDFDCFQYVYMGVS